MFNKTLLAKLFNTLKCFFEFELRCNDKNNLVLLFFYFVIIVNKHRFDFFNK